MSQKLSVSVIAKEDAILKTLVTDLSGGLREIIFPTSYLPEIIEVGIAYDGSSFEGVNDINSSDSIIKGVEETLIKVDPTIADTEKAEYWIICEILDTAGNQHPNCSRGKLVELQKKLAKKWKGGNMFVGAEPEAFFVEKKEEVGRDIGGNANYFNPKDPKKFIISEMMNVLGNMDFKIERAHSEVGDEQFEINWRFDRAEITSDKIQIFKQVSHKVARNYGFDVTFLPKPYPNRNGSGMHIHLSVGDGKNNFFFDEKSRENRFFSKKALNFLSGILKEIPSLAAISNRTEVSYSRLVPGFEAPCVIAMGACNRSAACRIPAIADPKIMEKGIRAEFRFPDPLANPYLLCSGFIAFGITGIEEETKFRGFCEENLYAMSVDELIRKRYKLIPRTLWDSYKNFTRNQVLEKMLGKSMHSSYAGLILKEVDTCQPFANAKSVQMHYFD
jgi:glutamine synthetase